MNEKSEKMNCSQYIPALLVSLFFGMVLGFLIAPVKNGLSIGCDNRIRILENYGKNRTNQSVRSNYHE